MKKISRFEYCLQTTEGEWYEYNGREYVALYMAPDWFCNALERLNERISDIKSYSLRFED